MCLQQKLRNRNALLFQGASKTLHKPLNRHPCYMDIWPTPKQDTALLGQYCT